MKLLSLSLRGAIGIERGLGVEQIDIDFTQFDAGLIALVAPNGSGKSTLMENLQVFRTLASRSGALQQHFYLRDSHRDLRFEMGGHVYRCRLLIDGVRGKQESYLYRDDEPLNDGKTPSYDAAVRDLFGSEDMFFRSLFRAQNAQSIADLTAGRRKDFFVELLGLARIAEYHERAKARAREIEDRLSTDRARIDILRSDGDEYEAARDSWAEAEKNVTAAREGIASYDAEIATHRAALDAARAELAGFEAYERQAAQLRERIAELERSRAEIQQRATAIEARIRAAAADLSRAQIQAAERRDAVITEQTARKARAEKIAANRQTIIDGIASLDDARARLDTLDAAQKQHAAVSADIAAIEKRIASAESEFRLWQSRRDAAHSALHTAMLRANGDHDARLARMEDAIAENEKVAALTGQVPCAGTDMQPGCALLCNAIDAADALPTLRADLDAARLLDPCETPEIEAMRKALDAIDAEKPEQSTDDEESAFLLGAQLAALNYDAAAHEAARASFRQHDAKGWPALLVECDGAAQTMVDCDAAITAAHAQHDTDVHTAAERCMVDHERANSEKTGAVAELDRVAEQIDNAQAELAKAEEVLGAREEVDAKVSAAQRALDSATDHRAVAGNVERDAVEHAAARRARMEACERARAEADEIEARIAPDTRELEEWLLLARATGKDGVQALELDAAGPGVAAIANELLADTFGSGFQIAFETTRLSADGKSTLEVFDIRVTTEDGEQAIENLSGGQRVWIEAALSQAVAIYLRRKSGLDLRTSFLDEADGALDTDNAWHYLAMLRASHDLAGTHHTFLITHRRELLSHIPQQIRLVPGVGIEVQA